MHRLHMIIFCLTFVFRSLIYCILYCFRLERKTAYENNLIETESIHSLKMDWYNKRLTECTSVASNIRLWHHNSFHAEIPFDICMWADFSTRSKFPQVKQMPRKYTSLFWLLAWSQTTVHFEMSKVNRGSPEKNQWLCLSGALASSCVVSCLWSGFNMDEEHFDLIWMKNTLICK